MSQSNSESVATTTTIVNPMNFNALLTAFSNALKEAFNNSDIQILRSAYDSFSANTDHDKKSPLDQAFREMLLFHLSDKVESVGALVKLSVEAVRAEIVSVTIPVVLLGDIFETVTLDKCDKIFTYVEDMVEIWKEDIFFSSCKNNILRMCNDLLRRLSRAQNTVFCGRILLFLSKFFPFSERSGLNIVSEFNLDNVTEYGVDGKDRDDVLEDTVEKIPIRIDYNFYCRFWSLQDFFRDPNQCYSKTQWKMFQSHAASILQAFSNYKLEYPRLDSASTSNPTEVVLESSQHNHNTKNSEQDIFKSDRFFAKFLTNPKLLALQLSDSNFRRSVLVQFLILFQYLQLTVKFKADSNTLSASQTEFIKQTESEVYRLLEETPSDGKRFGRAVRHMLEREELWNKWKNDGCKEFKKPEEITSNIEEDVEPPQKRVKLTFGQQLREANHSGKFFLGNDGLTRLWNYSPDNLQACKSKERNFLPQIDAYLNSQHGKNDLSFEWRALRLLARQTPHFFNFLNSPFNKISDYLEGVRRKISKEKLEASKATLKSNSLNPIENNKCIDQSVQIEMQVPEQESETIQEQVTEQETKQVLEEGDDDQADDLEKVEDELTVHAKHISPTKEHIEEIAPIVGEDWMKLGKKLGFTNDELLYFETEHNSERNAAAIAMLSNWASEDEDATLENLSYILDGLKIHKAAKAVKAIIERLSSKDDKIEVLSD